MKSQFVPYNIAKKLKDLGFKDNCFGVYGNYPEEFVFSTDALKMYEIDNSLTLAPLWQQVTAWLRDTKNINVFVGFRPNVKKWDSFYYDMNMNGKEYVKERTLEKYRNQPIFDTYEEALESAIIDYVNKN